MNIYFNVSRKMIYECFRKLLKAFRDSCMVIANLLGIRVRRRMQLTKQIMRYDVVNNCVHQGPYTVVIRLLYGCYTAVIRLLNGCYTAVIRLLYGCYTLVIRLLHNCIHFFDTLLNSIFLYI